MRAWSAQSSTRYGRTSLTICSCSGGCLRSAGPKIGLDERLVVMTDADRAHLRSVAGRRARQGLPLTDFLHAYRVSQQVIWQELRAATSAVLSADALLDAVEVLLGLLDYRITQAGEAYLAAQQMLVAESERIRRDLLEDLLAGREPATGEGLAVANAAGLDAARWFLLIAARMVGSTRGSFLGATASFMNRAAGGAIAPLTVVRQQEIVIVRAVESPHVPAGLIAGIGAAQVKLRDDGMTLVIGISTVHAGIGEVPDAYREASVAVGPFNETGGVVALPELSVFDYLTLRRDPISVRLVPAAIWRFIAEDMRQGGTLIGPRSGSTLPPT